MPIENLKFDVNSIPSTLDAFHISLLCLALVLALSLLLMTSIALFRSGKRASSAARLEVPAKAVELKTSTPTPVVAVPEPAPVKAANKQLSKATPDAALQLLGLLQQEARFIDFVSENVNSYSDAEIGAAARVVHDGCSKVMKQHFKLESVSQDNENSRVTLQKGFNPAETRISGNIVGEPPFTGTLLHRGWRVSNVDLPTLAAAHDVHVIAPAEVEL